MYFVSYSTTRSFFSTPMSSPSVRCPISSPFPMNSLPSPMSVGPTSSTRVFSFSLQVTSPSTNSTSSSPPTLPGMAVTRVFSTNGAVTTGTDLVSPTTPLPQPHIRTSFRKNSSIYSSLIHSCPSYAPAYKRYGHQINAIHFIGPNKPWKSIPYRTPFTSKSSSTSANPAYDYDSLVDRWFDVYDRHYSNELSSPQYDFHPQRYASAWDNPSGTSQPPSTLPLDELKRLAIEGLNSNTVDSKPGEGTYTSLPLGGRVDLMRPKKERMEEPKQSKAEPQRRQHPTQLPAEFHPLFSYSIDYDEVLSTPTAHQAALGDGEAQWHTLPTPGPNEVPPSPILRTRTLPSTPSAFPVPPPDFYASESEQDEQGLGLVTGQHAWQHEHHKHSHRHEPRSQRPPSPPMMSWNPAVEPPPNVTPVANTFPTDTYYANAWDRTPNSRHGDLKHTPRTSPTKVVSGGFFQPPASATIPDVLIKEGHYRNVMGDTNMGMQPSPDRSKIKTVFPWEEKPRIMPGRVFPDSDAPAPSLFLSPSSQTSTTLSTPEIRSTPEMKAPSARATSLSPLQVFPVSVTYSNAWDTVPSIQKYASRLVKPPAPLPPVLQPAFEELAIRKEKRKKSWDERTELSSRDGDDEDNADDEDDDEAVAPSATKWDDDSDGESAKRRSRRGSIVTANTLVKGQKKEYRSRGVQTEVVESRSVGIQVDTTPAARPKRVSKRHWTPSTHPSTMVTNTARAANAGLGVNALQPSPTTSPNGIRDHVKTKVKSSSESPSARSSREFIVPPGATTNASKAIQNTSPPARPNLRTMPSNSSTSTVVPTPSYEDPQRSFTFPPALSPATSTPTATSPIPLQKSLSSSVAFPRERSRQNSNAIASSTSHSSAISHSGRPSSSMGFRSSPSSIGRRPSNESSLGSPASSIGPVSPVDTATAVMSPPMRKGTRVWDPARGVDVFKRGSEEVLAKFLKMGSWEDEQQ